MTLGTVMIVAGILAIAVFAIGLSAAKKAGRKVESGTPAE